jgi:hypothetical protein
MMCERTSPTEFAAGRAEIDVHEAARVLGIAVPRVLRRMDDGRLPFRQEGDRRLAKLEDVVRLKAELEREERLLRGVAEAEEVDFQPKPRL